MQILNINYNCKHFIPYKLIKYSTITVLIPYMYKLDHSLWASRILIKWKEKLKTKKHMQPNRQIQCLCIGWSCWDRQTTPVNSILMHWLGSNDLRLFDVLKSHNKQEQNQDNIVGCQAYRLIINDVHKYIFIGSKLSKAWSFIFSNSQREEYKSTSICFEPFHCVLCLYREHGCKF